jgi:hypothetical protein|tara:strand:- start:181 stop:546 length:366 start_codon:yes stop_codon:yes gene_type:complete
MKTPPGLLFLGALLVLLTAALAGGQVWALTGSTPLGITVTVCTGALLGLGSRPLVRRLTPGRRQFFGEYHGALEEGDFVDVAEVVSDTGSRGKVRHGAEHRPDRVAGSVRSLLDDKKGAGR